MGKTQSRIGVLREIKTPLSLLALALLIIEIILGLLAHKADGANFTILLVGMLLALLLIIGIGGIVLWKRPGPTEADGENPGLSKPVQIKYDVFVASPMAGFEDAAKYEKDRNDILQLISTLREKSHFKSIIYAGQDIKTIKDFDAPDVSVKDDLLALRASHFFILVYSEKIVSSVLVEIGIALALGKPAIIFVRDRKHLPFLLRQAEQAFSNVRIYEHAGMEEICKHISKHSDTLFDFSSGT